MKNVNSMQTSALAREQEWQNEYGDLLRFWICELEHTVSEISQKTGISEQLVRKYVRNKNEEQFALQKENARKKAGIKRRKLTEKKYQKIDDEYGDRIETLLEQGVHMTEIIRQLEFSSSCQFQRYVKWKDGGADGKLRQKINENASKIIRTNALKHSKQGAEKTRGVQLKPLTHEAKKRYRELKENDVHQAAIEREQSELGYGPKKVQQLIDLYGKPKKLDCSGANNPMYGVPAPKKSGNGVKGWINKGPDRFFFRSSQEFRVFCYLLTKEIDFSLCKHRIEYVYEGKRRTYCPDIVIGDCIYEIKPKKLENIKINKAKFKAARQYCKNFSLNFDIINEFTYDLDLPQEEDVQKMIDSGFQEINKKNLEKYYRNLGRIERDEKNYRNKRNRETSSAGKEGKS